MTKPVKYKIAPIPTECTGVSPTRCRSGILAPYIGEEIVWDTPHYCHQEAGHELTEPDIPHCCNCGRQWLASGTKIDAFKI